MNYWCKISRALVVCVVGLVIYTLALSQTMRLVGAVVCGAAVGFILYALAIEVVKSVTKT